MMLVRRVESSELSPLVWDVSLDVKIEYVSISSSLAVDMMRVAISPLVNCQ